MKILLGNFVRATLFSTKTINNNIFRSFGWITVCINSSCDMWFWCIRKSTQCIFEINRTRCSFKQPQNSSPKKSDSYRKRVKTSESLKCKLTRPEKNQNTECQNEIYNKGMMPSWPAGFSITRKCASEMHCMAEKLKRDAKRQGERFLSDAHRLGW